MQRYTNSGQTLRAMLALLALTGQIGRPGAGWMYANLQTAVFHPLKEPLNLYPPEQPDGVVRVGVSTARLGRDMAAQADPPLRMAWVERGNPIPQNPDTNAVRKAFRRAGVPRRRGGVPDRHRPRGRPRPAGQEPLRADRRHRRLLASLHPDQAEAGRAPRPGQAGERDLLAPGPPAGHVRGGPGRAHPRAVRRGRRGVAGRPAGALPRADPGAAARGPGAGARRGRGRVRRRPLPDAVGPDRAVFRGGGPALGRLPAAGLQPSRWSRRAGRRRSRPATRSPS